MYLQEMDESASVETLPQDETSTATEDNEKSTARDLRKLSFKQLQVLAKQRGIGIARTKADFIKIILNLDPEAKVPGLRGKRLSDRVTELSISRLRTKADLVRLLSA